MAFVYRDMEFGNPDDCEQVLNLTQQLLEEGSAFKAVPLDRDVMRNTLLMLSDPEHKQSVAMLAFHAGGDRSGELAGGILGMASQSFFSKAVVAEDLGLFVAPDVRGSGVGHRLVESFLHWAHSMGATRVTLGNSAGMDDKLFTGLLGKSGFSLAGSLMYMDI